MSVYRRYQDISAEHLFEKALNFQWSPEHEKEPRELVTLWAELTPLERLDHYAWLARQSD